MQAELERAHRKNILKQFELKTKVITQLTGNKSHLSIENRRWKNTVAMQGIVASLYNHHISLQNVFFLLLIK